MKRLLGVALIVILLAGCGPQVPPGLEEVIRRDYPEANFIEAKEVNYRSWNVWCVAYEIEVPNSGTWVVVDLYFERTWGWEQAMDVRSHELFAPGISKPGGWCEF